jgi:hypothetical protein
MAVVSERARRRNAPSKDVTLGRDRSDHSRMETKGVQLSVPPRVWRVRDCFEMKSSGASTAYGDRAFANKEERFFSI